jgi:3-hydroxyacyl-CoA dehydrogenase
VVHPANPPYLLRVVEIVPAPFTDAKVTAQVMELMAFAEMSTVLIHREIEGFVFNRLQGAVLREAYALVRDGIATVADIDRLVRDGLGLRWSVMGPFETVDLNTRGGIAAHAERMLPAYRRMGEERGERALAWPQDVFEKVIAERRAALPLEDWEDRVAWRDRELMALLVHRLGRGKGQG